MRLASKPEDIYININPDALIIIILVSVTFHNISKGIGSTKYTHKENNADYAINKGYVKLSDKMINGYDFLTRSRLIKIPIKNVNIDQIQKRG